MLQGRWRCALCPYPVWVRGTYADWLDHYQTEHQDKGGPLVAWFKLDDAMWSHPKFLGLSDRAHRLWVRAGAYCAQHLTDGLVTEETLRILGAQRRHCDELWTVGLWERVPEGGYRFHDWADYQPTREEVSERRRRDAERKRLERSKANRHPDTGRFT